MCSEQSKTYELKVFNLTSEVNETRFSVQHESCECKCEFNEGVCNSNQKWNHDECQCECKGLDDWSSYPNLSTCNCKFNKTCKFDEYLDTNNCSCKKRLLGTLVLACEDETSNVKINM